jgi:hypothetical protein
MSNVFARPSALTVGRDVALELGLKNRGAFLTADAMADGVWSPISLYAADGHNSHLTSTSSSSVPSLRVILRALPIEREVGSW